MFVLGVKDRPRGVCVSSIDPLTRKEAIVTRESKLALIIGFVLVLVVGVLVSDHFSQASTMALDTQEPERGTLLGPIANLGETEKQGINNAIGNAWGARSSTPSQQTPPVTIHNGGARVPGASSSNNNSIIDSAWNEAKRLVQDTDLPKAAQVTPRDQVADVRALPVVSYGSYKVVAGDSLIKIARERLGDGDRWTEIHELNADILGPDAILKIGVYLKLPSDARGTTQRRSDTARSSSPASATTYTVVAGDILGNISMKLLGTSRRADEIAELNGLDSSNDIRVGMKLKIPVK